MLSAIASIPYSSESLFSISVAVIFSPASKYSILVVLVSSPQTVTVTVAGELAFVVVVVAALVVVVVVGFAVVVALVVDVVLSDLLKQTNREIGIISGLAKGIDTEAHLTTIKQSGHTIGVVGTGLDIFYPSKNKMLQEIMGRDHLVISEYPIGSQPLKHHFPERNRIIAGLSRGVLVIESKKSSGSLITAYNALEESRDVFVVPGSIFEPHREGNHKLIQLGAILVQTSEDILAEWVFI